MGNCYECEALWRRVRCLETEIRNLRLQNRDLRLALLHPEPEESTPVAELRARAKGGAA